MSEKEQDRLRELAKVGEEKWMRHEGARMNGRVKPKIHMLFHCAQFAFQYKYLGRFSEGPIESHHGQIRKVWEEYANKGKNEIAKMMSVAMAIGIRRCPMVNERRKKLNLFEKNKNYILSSSTPMSIDDNASSSSSDSEGERKKVEEI